MPGGQEALQALSLVAPGGLRGAAAGQGVQAEGAVLLAKVPAGQAALQEEALAALKRASEGQGAQAAEAPPGLELPAAHPTHCCEALTKAVPGGQGMHTWAPGWGATRPGGQGRQLAARGALLLEPGRQV